MAIILPHGRPAIDIVKGSYERPDEPWGGLGDPEPRAQLEVAISAVDRVDFIGHPSMSWGGTAFAVGPDLLLTMSLGPLLRVGGKLYEFNDGQSAYVDFGHDPDSVQSLRVEIEEVIYVDHRWKVELVKAPLPDTMTPLALSVLNPDTLDSLGVVVFGYPSSDVRNDALLMQQPFRGTLGTERMLLGRVNGRKTWLGEGDRKALMHD